MGVVIPNLLTEDRVSGAQIVDGSLRFDNTKTQYLQREPGTGGNRRTFTLSVWVKRGKVNVNEEHALFSTPTSSNLQIYFGNSGGSYADKLLIGSDAAGYYRITNRVFRDPSAWYNIVIAVDTTNGTDADRIKGWVNGEILTWQTSNSITQNTELVWNIVSTIHRIGARPDLPYDGLLLNAYNIDGQALGPEYFGYTDPLTNTWRPKKLKLSNNDTTYPNQIGRTWSDDLSASAGFQSDYPAVAAFDGNYDCGNECGRAASNSANSSLTFSPTGGIVVNDKIEVWTRDGTITVNGGSGYTSSSTAAWKDVSSVSPATPFTLTSLVVTGTPSNAGEIYAIRIDGVILKNNAGWGKNGFYLPLDGNTPIGKDQSGRGNNWTPVNFGGSNTIEKATGALPILNTDGGGKVARVGVRTDSNASSLVLALPLVGIKSDFSNAINSGTTEKAITASGAVADFTSSNFYGGGFNFDGTDDYITTNVSTDFQLGTSDFTVECWFYHDSMVNGDQLVNFQGTSGSNLSPSLFYTDNTGPANVYIYLSSNGSSFDIANSVNIGKVNTGTWNHYALCRSGSTFYGFVNGVLGTTFTNSSSIYQHANQVTLCARAGYYTDGKMQDLRIYKGVAKYTQNFIPASTDPDILPDTPSGVAYSSNVALVPSTDGAVAFDGSGDYLSASDSADFELGSGDFTIEFYAYPKSLSSDSTVISKYSSSNKSYLVWMNSTTVYFTYSTDGSSNAASLSVTYSVPLNKWTHFAMARNGSTLNMFIDGVLVSSPSISGTLYDGSSNLQIGRQEDGTQYYWNGFISNVRIIKGTALYTSNFTPPTAPLTAVANTKLLTCQSNTSAKLSSIVPVSGINDGTIWSDYFISGSPNTIAPNSFQSAFDGLTTGTGYYPQPNTEAIWQPPSSISFTTLKLWTYKDNTPGQLYIKDGTDSFIDVTSQIPGHNGVGPQETTITGLTSPLKAIKWVSGNWPQNVVVKAVNIDGTILRDPIIVNGNAAASNFNPFTANINAVRGQETGYATLNPLDNASNFTLSNGNLTVQSTGSYGVSYANIAFNSGKWYWEYLNTNSSNRPGGVGIDTVGTNANTSGQGVISYWYHSFDGTGQVYVEGTSSSYGSSYTGGDLISVALDLDARTISFYKNGINLGVAATGIRTGFDYKPCVVDHSSIGAAEGSFNFGQKPFKFPPPAGFQPLNAANVRPSTVVARPDQYVGIVTYSGLGNSGMKVSGYNFKPDLIWIKARNQTYNNILYDSVRGTGSTKAIFSDDTVAEGSYSQYVNLASFDRDGFTVGSTGANNNAMSSSAANFVAWCWKAGGNSNTYNINDVGYATASAAGLTAGTITPTGASVGTKQGFSIIKYTGTNSNDSVPHGLLQAPNFVIIKDLDDTQPWVVGHTSIGFTKYLWLNSQNGEASLSTVWQDTAPTSSVFTIGATAGVNASGDNYIAYLWHNVPGLQKFGSFIGNLSTDGPFVELGFRAKFIIYKVNQNSHNWMMFDSERDKYNICSASLRGNLSNIESSFSALDICSNGFKFRNTDTNPSGAQIIYAAFAEAPSFNLYGAQANAR